MTRINKLFENSLLTIERSDHPSGVPHLEGRERQVSNYEITFVERGKFSIRRDSEIACFDEGDVLLSHRGAVERFFHPEARAEDVCLSVKLHVDAFEAALGARVVPRDHVKRPASSINKYQLHRIKQGLQTGDPLLIEELSVTAAHAFAPSDSPRDGWSSVDQNLSWYTRRVCRICDYVNHDYSDVASLAEMSKLAGISAFHLSRVFHYLVGLPLHRYVARRRIVAAARAIQGGMNISEAAYSAGFSSLSYFSRAFKRHFGFAPRTMSCRQTLSASEAARDA